MSEVSFGYLREFRNYSSSFVFVVRRRRSSSSSIVTVVEKWSTSKMIDFDSFEHFLTVLGGPGPEYGKSPYVLDRFITNIL